MPRLENLRAINKKQVSPCYFRKLKTGFLLTNDLGRHCLLSPLEVQRYLRGKVAKNTVLYARLQTGGFLKTGLNFGRCVEEWKKKHAYFWFRGPGLHRIAVTARGGDMSLETAAKVVDRIFQAPNPSVSVEFLGGEPLGNWPAVRFIIEKSLERAEKCGKRLRFILASDLNWMDEKKLQYLLGAGVRLRIPLDGPQDLHDRNRALLGGCGFEHVERWWTEILRHTSIPSARPNGWAQITRFSLGRPEEIIDTYVKLGARSIELRPLSPIGLTPQTWDAAGVTPQEVVDFYRRALDHILLLNSRKQGLHLSEKTAKMFLIKILRQECSDPPDVRSPCGAGVGQIAYDWDGSIFTCDEGRRLGCMGDEAFKIGAVDTGSYAETVGHPTVRAMAMASTLENQPQCSLCAYKPFCGVCPVYNYAGQSDLFGNMPSNPRCRIHMGILDALFEKFTNKRFKVVFDAWVAQNKGEPLY
ncbi:MAG: SPASM domain-containing protein [Elusimicrobia bacterium]|nr:SPASM domain-containing protein [Elusimicrobiota bacterium]